MPQVSSIVSSDDLHLFVTQVGSVEGVVEVVVKPGGRIHDSLFRALELPHDLRIEKVTMGGGGDVLHEDATWEEEGVANDGKALTQVSVKLFTVCDHRSLSISTPLARGRVLIITFEQQHIERLWQMPFMVTTQ